MTKHENHLDNNYILHITSTEWQRIVNALQAQVQGWRDYLKWIDDRPGLPEREEALANLRTEIKAEQELLLRFFDRSVLKEHHHDD